jgi:Flp pilus assembly protein TadG
VLSPTAAAPSLENRAQGLSPRSAGAPIGSVPGDAEVWAMHFRRRLGEDGASAIEAALVAPIVFLVMLGVLELGFLAVNQALLDWGTRDAARAIRTGQLLNASDPLGAFRTRLCANISPIIPCGDLVIQSQVFNSWANAQNTTNQPPDRDKNGNLISDGFSAGSGQQILVVQVAYNYSFLSGLFGANTAFLMSTVAFRNEPFP